MPLKRAERTVAGPTFQHQQVHRAVDQMARRNGLRVPRDVHQRISKLITRKRDLTDAEDAELSELTAWWHEHKRHEKEYAALLERIAGAWESHVDDADFIDRWEWRAEKWNARYGTKTRPATFYKIEQLIRAAQGKDVK